jgi:hypothetical protein
LNREFASLFDVASVPSPQSTRGIPLEASTQMIAMMNSLGFNHNKLVEATLDETLNSIQESINGIQNFIGSKNYIDGQKYMPPLYPWVAPETEVLSSINIISPNFKPDFTQKSE